MKELNLRIGSQDPRLATITEAAAATVIETHSTDCLWLFIVDCLLLIENLIQLNLAVRRALLTN